MFTTISHYHIDFRLTTRRRHHLTLPPPVFPFLCTQTLKFDNLCANFYEHEDLDGSGAVLTAKKDATGAIIDMTLATSSNNGAPIPLTIPTADAASVSNLFTTYDMSYTNYSCEMTTYALHLFMRARAFCIEEKHARAYSCECPGWAGGVVTYAGSTRSNVVWQHMPICFLRSLKPTPLVPLLPLPQISTGALVKESTVTYGADTTYIFAAGTLTSRDLSKPATRLVHAFVPCCR